MLIGWIESNLTNMFTDVNEKVGTIAAEVGQTPVSYTHLNCPFDEMMIYSKNLEVPRNAYQRELNPNRVRKIAADAPILQTRRHSPRPGSTHKTVYKALHIPSRYTPRRFRYFP